MNNSNNEWYSAVMAALNERRKTIFASDDARLAAIGTIWYNAAVDIVEQIMDDTHIMTIAQQRIAAAAVFRAASWHDNIVTADDMLENALLSYKELNE